MGAGAVEDYNATDLQETFAAEAGVNRGAVSVVITPASVLITVSIATSSAADSDVILGRLSSGLLANATAASAALGITVEIAPVIGIYSLAACRPGTFDAGHATCVGCPAGYACAYNTSIADLHSALCPVGFYCPLGTATPIAPPSGQQSSTWGQAYPTPCAPGTYSVVNATGGTPACTACPSGYECAAMGTSVPTPCPSGFYRDMSSGAVRCESCAVGSFWEGVGGASPSVCVSCAEGTTSMPGSASSSACVPVQSATCADSPSSTAAVVIALLGALLGAAGMLLLWAIVPSPKMKPMRVTPPKRANAQQHV